MRKQSNSGSKLFLTELMIAIFFFAVISAICIQAFSEAHTRSVESEELTQGVNAASNAAEYFMVWDGSLESWQEVFPEGSWKDGVFEMEFNKGFQPAAADGEYLLQMKVSEKDGLRTADIAVKKRETDRMVYQLEVVHGE